MLLAFPPPAVSHPPTRTKEQWRCKKEYHSSVRLETVMICCWEPLFVIRNQGICWSTLRQAPFMDFITLAPPFQTCLKNYYGWLSSSSSLRKWSCQHTHCFSFEILKFSFSVGRAGSTSIHSVFSLQSKAPSVTTRSLSKLSLTDLPVNKKLMLFKNRLADSSCFPRSPPLLCAQISSTTGLILFGPVLTNYSLAVTFRQTTN